MFIQIIIFLLALSALLLSAKFFTGSAEEIGRFLKLPDFIVGIFIIGIGTSLPELVAAIISVSKGVSEVVAGNVMGANISNIFLITGLIAVIHKKDIHLSQQYMYIDLHYLVGAFIVFTVISIDGEIKLAEAVIGILAFFSYSFYLVRSGSKEYQDKLKERATHLPIIAFLTLIAASLGIYFGAEYTISALSKIATMLQIPPSIIALTALSLGTTLPELAVNIHTIRKGKSEIAIGNVLGSCIFNSLMVTGLSSFFGNIHVPEALMNFSLPMMCVSGLFFYLLSQDKRLSMWEGMLFVLIYVLFVLKVTAIA
ncbi:MAG: sodium:calcium antiporter [Chitinophagales bacterium]|nr:sodium:calcium antiporter [Chitinophagales bacterium]MDW8272888.1 sodium:calcium antiporter [Chitinophagales bacterium]